MSIRGRFIGILTILAVIVFGMIYSNVMLVFWNTVITKYWFILAVPILIIYFGINKKS